ncbi:MAG: hypothetical protein NW226_19900 [Microscillaceae bacterium]|nr:hypothetical protein [Microscillaceae bacterium]
MSADQINFEEINKYSQAFAQRLSDYFFIDHDTIEGKDILKFCDIQQVNLLILKNLFEKWQSETSKLRSPYFDYNRSEVKQALETFMNALSQYIAIQKVHFMPLLTEATRDSLILILAPEKFYEQEIQRNAHTQFSIRRWEDIQKYIQYNKQLLKAFIEQLRKIDPAQLNTARASEVLSRVYTDNQRYIEPVDWRLKNFSDVFQMDIDKIYKRPLNPSFANQDNTTKIIEDVPTIITQKTPKAETVQVTQNSLVGNPVVLNDTLKSTHSNLLDNFQKAKIQDIRAAISLNQKFLFTNRLFNGDSFAFNDAITRIESCRDLSEATQVITQEYAPKYLWEMDSEEVISFMEIVGRRFD